MSTEDFAGNNFDFELCALNDCSPPCTFEAEINTGGLYSTGSADLHVDKRNSIEFLVAKCLFDVLNHSLNIR